MVCSQVLEGLQRIVHQDATVIAGILSLIDDSHSTSLLQSGSGILVAVKGGPFQRKENGIGRTVPAISGNLRMLQIDSV